ncbi:MAG: DUF58 domain-containing protein [Marinilabiliaceae bacterium]|nr:DUF58 domain-containing protein [Marinilabiliaceae bacterium]
MQNFWKSFFVTAWFYRTMGFIILIFVLGYFFQILMLIGLIALVIGVLITLIDIIQLYYSKNNNPIEATRNLPERFSNGDNNDITIIIKNNYTFKISLLLTEELPFQFQIRDFKYKINLLPNEQRVIKYTLKPSERGEYHFGHLNAFVQTPFHLLSRRLKLTNESIVKVYPSFLQMRKFELLAISNRLNEYGIKKIRKIGHHIEFDQIRDYIKGDDYRTINWKATARKSHLMVNQYQDEKSQQVYSLIDMGRTMKMPFEQMSLLDYAINTSLVISNIAMLKHDKAGLITFNHKVCSQIPAQRHQQHLQTILECLYNQKTGFTEHDMSNVYGAIRRQIHQRSLLLLFTNFESLNSAKRQIPVLQKLAKDHLVVVIFFENTEIKNITEKETKTTEDIYIKTIAEKFIYDKKLIVSELERFGIHAVLSEPENLTVNTINKYLELKARGYI